jgi:Cu/Zn superoxide dismutase
MLEKLILLLMTLTPYYKDIESISDRQVRITVISKAIIDAADEYTCQGNYATNCTVKWKGSKKQLVLMAAVQAKFETNYALHIHQGNCGPTECDPTFSNGKLIHLAKSLWQLHKNKHNKADWPFLEGTSYEATRKSAFHAMRVLISGYSCNGYEGAFAASAGVGCKWKGALPRIKTLNSWEPKL